jgi:hypothetical protein
MKTAVERMLAQERRADDHGRVEASRAAVALMDRKMPYRR